MKICIPSFNRYETINQKSLKVLLNGGYKPSEIDVFVANKEQYDKYKQIIHADINIIIGVKGLKNIREFIFDYYEEGEKLLCLDDDIEAISGIFVCEDNIKRPRPITNLKEIVNRGFDLCENHSLKLWGLYPCSNVFFMELHEPVTTDYKFIIGNFFGCINCKEMNKLSVLDYDDFERSIKSYLLYGGSVRMNHLSAKTKYQKNKGGCQETDRETNFAISREILLTSYPDFIFMRKRRGRQGGSNPVLKDKR